MKTIKIHQIYHSPYRPHLSFEGSDPASFSELSAYAISHPSAPIFSLLPPWCLVELLDGIYMMAPRKYFQPVNCEREWWQRSMIGPPPLNRQGHYVVHCFRARSDSEIYREYYLED